MEYAGTLVLDSLRCTYAPAPSEVYREYGDGSAEDTDEWGKSRKRSDPKEELPLYPKISIEMKIYQGKLTTKKKTTEVLQVHIYLHSLTLKQHNSGNKYLPLHLLLWRSCSQFLGLQVLSSRFFLGPLSSD